MNKNMTSRTLNRREMLKQSAACLALGLSTTFRAARALDTQARHLKIGAVDWELTKANDPEALAVAAKLGFDGLQVDLGNVEPMKNPDRQQKYKALAREHKIEIASLALGALSNSAYGQDPKGQVLVDSAIDVAKAMNQKIILLAFFGANDLAKKENNTDSLVGRLKENAPKAEKAGVILGVEGETSVEHYKEIIDRVNSPAVKVYFDCVHAHGTGRDIYKEITFLGDRICEFHAKDYGNILFGHGNLDWKEVRRGMDAIGYRGWMQVEQWGEIKGDKPLGFDETHRRNLRYLREIF
jgi:sugar phosphate isomerase/epimerase